MEDVQYPGPVRNHHERTSGPDPENSTAGNGFKPPLQYSTVHWVCRCGPLRNGNKTDGRFVNRAPTALVNGGGSSTRGRAQRTEKGTTRPRLPRSTDPNGRLFVPFLLAPTRPAGWTIHHALTAASFCSLHRSRVPTQQEQPAADCRRHPGRSTSLPPPTLRARERRPHMSASADLRPCLGLSCDRCL